VRSDPRPYFFKKDTYFAWLLFPFRLRALYERISAIIAEFCAPRKRRPALRAVLCFQPLRSAFGAELPLELGTAFKTFVHSYNPPEKFFFGAKKERSN
jgi:hypothetical protein